MSTGACQDYVDLQDDSFDDDDEEYENLASDEGGKEEYMNASDLIRQRHSQGSTIDWKPKGPALNKQCGPPKPPSKTRKEGRHWPPTQTQDSDNELQYVINPRDTPGKVKQLPPIPGSKTPPGKATTLPPNASLSDQIKNTKLRSTPAGLGKSNNAPDQGKSNNTPSQGKPKTSNVIPAPQSGIRAKSPCSAMRSPPAADSTESDNKKKFGGKFPTPPIAPVSATPKIDEPDCPPQYKAPAPPKNPANKHWSTGSTSPTDDSGVETDTISTNTIQLLPNPGGKHAGKPKTGVIGVIDQNLTRFSWFLGDASRESAEGKVREDGQDGSFIIRKSHHAGPDHPFTLTVLYSGKIFNVPIRFLSGDGTYAMGSVKKDELRFASVENIVQHFCLNPIDLVPHDRPAMGSSRVVLKYRRAR